MLFDTSSAESNSKRAILILCFFFFSSRRRHTRSLRDWSSDVCSSDLVFDPFYTTKPVGKARALADRLRGVKRIEYAMRLLDAGTGVGKQNDHVAAVA